MGAQDYLVKGAIDSKLLIRAIRYALERHRIESALRRSEEEYRSLINDVFLNSDVGVLILDRDFRVVWVNEATERYFCLEREAMLEQDNRVLVEQHMSCLVEDPEGFARQILDSYANDDYSVRFECHVLAADQCQERWLERWSQPIRSGMYAGGRIEQFTDVTARVRSEHAEREQRMLAEALREIAALLTSTLDTHEVLVRILTTLARVVPHDAANILLMKGDHIDTARFLGYRNDCLMSSLKVPVWEIPFLQEMAATRSPLLAADIDEHHFWDSLDGVEDLHAYAGIPIILQDRVIGFISVYSRTAGFFTPEHAERLTIFGEQAAIALQNAQLFEQSQALATLEERQRLARELHDSVSQTLFTSNVVAESALRQWEHNTERARTLLEQVHTLTKSALAEMRILLLELRPASFAGVSFKQLTEQLVESMRSRKLQLAIVTDVDDIEGLPPDVHMTLYRILQESLNNVIKHSRAGAVHITVREQDDTVRLVIRDDGAGFEHGAVRPSSLGLGIMKERADAVGATLRINSSVGKGTQVEVTWPRYSVEEA
jgi:signal transduction histidine kinase